MYGRTVTAIGLRCDPDAWRVQSKILENGQCVIGRAVIVDVDFVGHSERFHLGYPRVHNNADLVGFVVYGNNNR